MAAILYYLPLLWSASLCFKFFAIGDPQHGFHNTYTYNSKTFEERRDITFDWLEYEMSLLNYDVPEQHVLTISGDLSHENDDADKYEAAATAVKDLGYSVVDCKGNHDTYPHDPQSAVSYQYNSYINWNTRTKDGPGVSHHRAYSEEFPPGSGTYYTHWNYAWDLHVGNGEWVTFISLQGDQNDANLEDNVDNMIAFLNQVLPEKYAQNRPVVIVLHIDITIGTRYKGAEMRDAIYQNGLNTVVAVVSGHMHCTPYGSYVHGTEFEYPSKHCMIRMLHFDVDYDDLVTNKWGRSIPQINTAAAFLGTYWRIGIEWEDVDDTKEPYITASRRFAMQTPTTGDNKDHVNWFDFKNFTGVGSPDGCDTNSGSSYWVYLCEWTQDEPQFDWCWSEGCTARRTIAKAPTVDLKKKRRQGGPPPRRGTGTGGSPSGLRSGAHTPRRHTPDRRHSGVGSQQARRTTSQVGRLRRRM